jgi:predicted dehydrogenase
LHAKQINLALEKGLHVYCEKPLANNLEEARQIAKATQKAGVLSHTAFVMRYYPAVQQAKSIMASGFLGEIYTFRGYLYHNSYMNPQRALTWRMQMATSGGGAMADLGIHYIDLVRYLLGDARWVQGRTRTLIQKRPKTTGSSEMATVDVDDWGMCMLEMENGAIGSIEAHRMSGGIRDNNRMQIFGSKGSLEIDMNHPDDVILYNFENKPVKFNEKDFPLTAEQRPIKDIFPPKRTSMGYFVDTHLASIMDFLLCIQENKPSSLNFDNALKAQEILEATYRSAAHNGETINLPLE